MELRGHTAPDRAPYCLRIVDLVDRTAGADALEKRQISCPCQESKPDSPVVNGVTAQPPTSCFIDTVRTYTRALVRCRMKFVLRRILSD